MTNPTPLKNISNLMQEQQYRKENLFSNTKTNNKFKIYTDTKRPKNPNYNIISLYEQIDINDKWNRSGNKNNKTYHGHKNQTLHHTYTLSHQKNKEETKKKIKINKKYKKENKHNETNKKENNNTKSKDKNENPRQKQYSNTTSSMSNLAYNATIETKLNSEGKK